MVETTQGLDDIFNLIESKLIGFIANYKAHNYRECVTALFYVAEGLVRYILATRGYFPISHEGIQVLLAQHFIKPRAVKKNIYNYLTNLYLRRKDADYKGFVSFDSDDIKTYWQWVVEIVDDLQSFFDEIHKQKIDELVAEGNRLVLNK
ncbi:MAG: HEPN domain-containing protein [Spirochaetota bacterium]